MTRKNFWKMFAGKAALAAVLPLLFLVSAAPAFAQTAEIRSAGVYYIDGEEENSDINDVYCNWSNNLISKKELSAYKSGIVNVEGHNADDPWQTSALIEYDQPYPAPNSINKYPNHCLALCMDVYCTNKPNGASTYSVSFPIQNIMFEIVKYNKSLGVANPETNPAVHTIYRSIFDNSIVDWEEYAPIIQEYEAAQAAYSQAQWEKQQGLYDYVEATNVWNTAQSAWTTAKNNYLRSDEVRDCRNPSIGVGGGACATPFACLTNADSGFTCRQNSACIPENDCQDAWDALQPVGATLDAAYTTYLAAKAVYNQATATYNALVDAETAARNRKIAAQTAYENLPKTSELQDLSNYMCAGYSCFGARANFEDTTTCPNPLYVCPSENCSGNCCVSINDPTKTVSTTTCVEKFTLGKANGAETKCLIKSPGTGKGYNDPIRFCTSWDGSYEILGEFGKTNGQFGFRSTIKTDYPGDGMAVENINIEQTYPYPGNNQYPIQVDVTNVHTVRSTPSVVGEITGVQALPYSLAYRLSKDSDVKIMVYDASAAVPVTNQGTTNISDNDAELILKQNSVVRNLVDWQPRLGEGMKGADSDQIIVESEQWDGRDDSGRLLPANNYLVSIQARSQDEWPGTDFSRAVTRQLSVDPLKLTDIEVQGLNKQSTAYATIRYVPTEASTVYFEVYSPGTTFKSLFTKGFEPTGSRPVIADNSGTLVYSSSQQRGRAQSYPDKWDGLCHNANGCDLLYAQGSKLPISGKIFDGDLLSCVGDGGRIDGDGRCVISFANGAPLPDGDYVYVLWAEVPYTSAYNNGMACNTQDILPTIHTPAGCVGELVPCTGTNGAYICEYDGTICPDSFDNSTTASVCYGVFTAVKTQKYYTGLLPVERGVVDITIQPVSYSTIGSSPTAYGLDPFIFKYSVAREANVEAVVKNTAGITVKTLTDEGGNTNVAQQMNTLSWDGRDDQGRMVGPGTYMFVVKTRDPMFPQSVQTTASALFPVDLYRVVDVSATDVYGDSGAKATINYKLSKAMNVQINIYNKDVVIPLYKDTGDSAATALTTVPAGLVTAVGTMNPNPLPNLTAGGAVPVTVTGAPLVTGDTVGYSYVYTEPVLTGNSYTYYRATKQVTAVTATTEDYIVSEVLQYTVPVTSWPPRVCDQDTDAAVFTNGYVDPTKSPQCIYVNDTTFTNYPANPEAAKYNYAEGAAQTLDVRLQPVKTFNRSALKAGEGVTQTEEWDAQYFYNPTPVSTLDGGKNTPEAVAACANQTDLKACPYEMIPDGTYPFYLAAQTEEPVNIYYDPTTAQPVRDAADVTPQTGLYATDKTVHRVNITRGPVYFLDGSVAVYPNAPQLFNTSSGPVFVPPYEINFAISRAATVEVAIVALEDGLCTSMDTPAVAGDPNVQMARAGDVCKYLSTMTIVNTPNFDPNVVRKIYWDGTDNNGYYVRNGNYEIRLTAKNYPDEGLYEPTVKQLTQNVDLLKVFDLPETEAYSLSKRGANMSISYQVSVPMKVAIQIFKPGTTIYDYQKGTLRDPATGKEVTDIRDVLVRAIVGIRPATTLIEEVWDGTDYAQQDVPDGTYPFRFVTALQSANIDSITGEILNSDDQSADPTQWSIEKVADTNQYVNLHRATVAIGDGEFVCEDWEKTVFFYPNPLKTPTGTMEITKLPVPGKMSFKLYNLAGDLVRESGYTCVDANNMSVTMGGSIDLSPDNTVSNTVYDPTVPGNMPNVRNAALRCFWDRTNQHGKKVARGVYFGLVDFRAQNGRQHCQKVVKILIPR